MNHILIISQDIKFVLTVRDQLVRSGYSVTTVNHLAAFQNAVLEMLPDLVVIEVPYLDARTIHFVSKFCRSPRTMHIAVVVISQKHPPNVIAQLLDTGADLFMVRPVASIELIARIRALLRRRKPQTQWNAKPIMSINTEERSVQIDGRITTLTPVEFDLLSYLCDTREDYHTARDLLHAVWNYPDGAGDQALVRNHIRNLRQKLEEDPERPRVVESMPKRGYRINADVRWVTLHSGK